MTFNNFFKVIIPLLLISICSVSKSSELYDWVAFEKEDKYDLYLNSNVMTSEVGVYFNFRKEKFTQYHRGLRSYILMDFDDYIVFEKMYRANKLVISYYFDCHLLKIGINRKFYFNSKSEPFSLSSSLNTHYNHSEFNRIGIFHLDELSDPLQSSENFIKLHKNHCEEFYSNDHNEVLYTASPSNINKYEAETLSKLIRSEFEKIERTNKNWQNLDFDKQNEILQEVQNDIYQEYFKYKKELFSK